MPVAAIADQLRASVMTIRRDLRGRSEAKQLADASTQTRPGSAR
jgi:DeoR/GlpR family transcriptional regulator of sugar metabolism